jgi:hypothetical protein
MLRIIYTCDEAKTKMNKPRITTCVLLLLLFLASASMLDVKSALADKVSVQWGHLAESPPAGEQTAESWICDQVYQDFVDAGTWIYSNAYWDYTQLWCVVQVLQYCEYPFNDVDWATNWWVGDFWTATGPDPFGHLGFYGHNDQHIFDYEVFAYANYYLWGNPPYSYWWQYIPSKQYFDFIWTCSNGGLYWYDSTGYTWTVPGITASVNSTFYPPPTNPFTQYGFFANPSSNPPIAEGMPLAWTGTSAMSKHGDYYPDSGSYCYVGWEGPSPWMIDYTGYDSVQYKWFPYFFYRYALGIDQGPTHHTIKQSLDYATNMVLGNGYYFGNSKFNTGEWIPWPGDPPMGGWWYRRMRVFGNGNLILPY